MITNFLTRCRNQRLLHQLLKQGESNTYARNLTVRNMTSPGLKKSLKKSQNYEAISPPTKKKAVTPGASKSIRSLSTSINLINLDETASVRNDLANQPDVVERTEEKLRRMSRCFGYNPEFNYMIYNDDNVLNCLTIKQRMMKFEVKWEIAMQGAVAHCKYKASVPGLKDISGETTGSNKKTAKKEAARQILSNLPPPTFEELDENSKWIISAHKNAINASDQVVDRSFGAGSHSCKIEWKLDDSVFLGTGKGATIKEAELYANQDLYVQTHKLKKQTPGQPEVAKTKRKICEASFEEELSKSDASQMNSLRNSVGAKMKVNQQEKVVSCPGGFQCTLTWVWKDSKGNYNKKVVCKQGSSKPLARASASKAMLVEVGTIQDVTSEESRAATEIRNQVNRNLAKAVDMSVDLIDKSNCSVWRLFLPQVWKEVCQKRNSLMAQKVVNAIVAAQERGSSHMPSDLWESFLQSLVYVMDDEFVSSCFHTIKSIKLDKQNFYSEQAMTYYQNNSTLLAMEYQSCIFNEVMLRKEMDHLYRTNMLVMSVARMQLPLISLTGQITHDYLKNNTAREDDVVLVAPTDVHGNLKSKSWDNAILCNVTKHKTEGLTLNLGLKLLSKVDFKGVEPTKLDNSELLLINRPGGKFANGGHSGDKSGLVVEGDDEAFSSKTYGLFHIQTMITHIRMMEALQALTHSVYPINSNASKYDYTYEMKETLLHCKKYHQAQPTSTMLPTSMSLTPAQNMACLSAIGNPLTLIQGPPGTGKTHVACAIIDSWNKLYPNDRILAVADSNVAADNLIEGLAKRDISALRIGASSESDLQEEAIKGLYRYNSYVQLRMSGQHKEANSLRVLLFTEAIKKHKIIIATCVGSGNEILTSHTFPYVIIDECAQSIEASNLIPIGRGCKSLVLIGDHKQLRPTIISTQASRQGLNKSLLERLIEEEVAPVHLLDVQRRMHPSIAQFPNMHFYQGLIRNQDVNDLNRPQIRGLWWPIRGSNLLFVDVSTGSPNSQFETSQGTSKYNTMEVTCVLAILNSFLKSRDVKENQIGILTPYDSQKWMIRKNVNLIKGYDTHAIEIDSVDGFQGKEKDLIIFSAVRSNLAKDIGFLKDPRRMNVMLTRARRGLVVLGDMFTLMNDAANWKPFIDWMFSMQLSVHVSQLNNYLEYQDDTLPKSNKHVQRSGMREFEDDSSAMAKNPLHYYANDAKELETKNVVDSWEELS